MVRAGSGKTLAQGRAQTRKLTKGFRRGRHNLYRQSIVTLIRPGVTPSAIAGSASASSAGSGSCASTPPAGCAAFATAR